MAGRGAPDAGKTRAARYGRTGTAQQTGWSDESMNATSLALPAGGVAGAVTNAPPATAAEPTDFLLMLGQLLGGAVAQNVAAAPKTPLAASTVSSDSDSTETADLSAAMAMLPVAPMMPWSNPQILPAAADAAADAISSLDLTALVPAGTGKRADSVAKDALLLANLTDALKSDDAGNSMPQNLSASQSPDAAQSVPVATGGDASSTRALHQPVGSSAWADELGTRMTLMASRGQHSASLRLSPEHLGPLEVRIAVRDDQASVWFGAAHADTRAAIEQALPRLRELFASQGLSLTDAGVFQ